MRALRSWLDDRAGRLESTIILRDRTVSKNIRRTPNFIYLVSRCSCNDLILFPCFSSLLFCFFLMCFGAVPLVLGITKFLSNSPPRLLLIYVRQVYTGHFVSLFVKHMRCSAYYALSLLLISLFPKALAGFFAVIPAQKDTFLLSWHLCIYKLPVKQWLTLKWHINQLHVFLQSGSFYKQQTLWQCYMLQILFFFRFSLWTWHPSCFIECIFWHLCHVPMHKEPFSIT